MTYPGKMMYICICFCAFTFCIYFMFSNDKSPFVRLSLVLLHVLQYILSHTLKHYYQSPTEAVRMQLLLITLYIFSCTHAYAHTYPYINTFTYFNAHFNYICLDRTCYPVASTNTKDFYNLAHVYLDAVFNPRAVTDPQVRTCLQHPNP